MRIQLARRIAVEIEVLRLHANALFDLAANDERVESRTACMLEDLNLIDEYIETQLFLAENAEVQASGGSGVARF